MSQLSQVVYLRKYSSFRLLLFLRHCEFQSNLISLPTKQIIACSTKQSPVIDFASNGFYKTIKTLVNKLVKGDCFAGLIKNSNVNSKSNPKLRLAMTNVGEYLSTFVFYSKTILKG